MTKPDTIVVSNRGPLSFRFDAEHNLQPLAGGGGLVSALRPLLTGTGTGTGTTPTPCGSP